jgi:hypothetical protein
MDAETDPIQIQIQTNQIFDEDEYCCGYSRRSSHVFGLICCVTVWGLLISTICSFFTNQNFGYITVGFLPVAYIFYLFEAFYSKIWRYLWNMKVAGGEDIRTTAFINDLSMFSL